MRTETGGKPPLARLDPQPFARFEACVLEQAGSTFLTGIRNINSVAENGITGQVANGYSQFRKTIARRGTIESV